MPHAGHWYELSDKVVVLKDSGFHLDRRKNLTIAMLACHLKLYVDVLSHASTVPNAQGLSLTQVEFSRSSL